jgi:beta-galactosidase
MPVYAYSNCDTVELFVNNKSYGRKLFEFPRKGMKGNWNTYEGGKVQTSTANLHLAWDVAYEPGELKLVGRKNGKEVVTRILTTGAPHAIRLSVDRDRIEADPSDVSHIKVEIVDSNGHVVPTADNLVKFEVTGADLIGVESGNMADLSLTKAPERKAFNGLCLAIVQAEKAGNITVKATAAGLRGAEVKITAQ